MVPVSARKVSSTCYVLINLLDEYVSVFATVAESFASKWILNDINHVIDFHQFGNVKGVSTSHYLVNLVHTLYAGAEEKRNIGTNVLTDFSKAFDLRFITLYLFGKWELAGHLFLGCLIPP